MLTHGSLFSGIGGFDLGFQRAGIRTIWQVEIDAYCRAVLAAHFPDAKRYEDIRDCFGPWAGIQCPTPERKHHHLCKVDIISGGFPCQDISNAGKRAGIEGERSGLWSEYARIIRELRPRFVVVENVAALLGRGMERVLGDLAACGYDAEWQSIRASDVGAPHRRERIWIVAYPNVAGSPSERNGGTTWRDGATSASSDAADAASKRTRSVPARSRHEGDGAPNANGHREDVADADSRGFAVQGESSGRGGFAARSGEAMAHSHGGRRQQCDPGERPVSEPNPEREDVSHTSKIRLAEPPQNGELGGKRFSFRSDGDRGSGGELPAPSWWAVEPDVGRVANGIPSRVDRLKGLGNAIVPQIAEFIGRRIVAAQ